MMLLLRDLVAVALTLSLALCLTRRRLDRRAWLLVAAVTLLCVLANALLRYRVG